MGQPDVQCLRELPELKKYYREVQELDDSELYAVDFKRLTFKDAERLAEEGTVERTTWHYGQQFCRWAMPFLSRSRTLTRTLTENLFYHANTIGLQHSERVRLVLAEAPLEVTRQPFFRLLFRQKAPVLVNLEPLMFIYNKGRFDENGRPLPQKCFPYWDDTCGGTDGIPSFKVTCRYALDGEVAQLPPATVARWLTITELASGKSHTVLQLHYLSWFDHCVPKGRGHEVRHLIRLATGLTTVLAAKAGRGSDPDGSIPLVVHCSGGIGRSGVFAFLFHAMDRPPPIRADDLIKELREFRLFVIFRFSQYEFCQEQTKAINEGEASEAEDIARLERENPVQQIVLSSVATPYQSACAFSTQTDSESD